MRRILLFCGAEGGLLGGAVMLDTIASFMPLWGWAIWTALCFSIAIGAIFIDPRGFRMFWAANVAHRGGKGIRGAALDVKFRLLFPLIKELAETSPPYPDKKVGELQKSLGFLEIGSPTNMQRWPEYLRHLKGLSKKGKLEQARNIHTYLDTTPDGYFMRSSSGKSDA